MPDWSAFAGVTVVVTLSLLVLVRLTNAVIERSVSSSSPERVEPGSVSSSPAPPEPGSMSPGVLLGNVAFTHGAFAVFLLGAVVLFGIPWWSLGVGTEPVSTGVGLGVGLGVVLFALNQVGVVTAGRFGFAPDEYLRELIAPDSLVGWVVLLGLVLPIVAGFEELLFRGAIVGAVSVGFETSPWVLAVVSSVAFALAHETQGRLGMLVTGLLGGALAVAFIVTGDLVVVVVAHYVVNAAEFVAHEAIGVPW